jgi:peptidoglycan/LPS O-acetylase OafA/YrhL
MASIRPAIANSVQAPGRIPSLDGWRAIAILLVLGSHTLFTSFFPKALEPWVGWIFDGELGVRIFLVLSGFLISLLLLKETERTGTLSLRRFYLRRIFRIFPIYFAYLAVLAALTLCGLYSDSAGSWIGCLTFTRNMLGRGRSGTIHFWSLAVEEQFYLLWPVMVSALRLWKHRALYLAILLVPIAICPIIRCSFVSDNLGATLSGRILGPRSILVYADSLATGCLGAWLAWKSSARWEWQRRHTLILLACFAALVGGHLLQVAGTGRAIDAVIPTVQAWAILGCIWLGTNEHSLGFGVLNSRPMVTIGVLSYSIYVWHLLFVSHFMGERFDNWPTHDWRIWFIPALILSALSYYFLEVPFMGLRKKFQSETAP